MSSDKLIVICFTVHASRQALPQRNHKGDGSFPHFPLSYNTHQKLYNSKDSYLRMLCWADISPLLIKLAYLSQKNSIYPLLFPLPVPVPAASRTCIQVPIWSTAMESVTVAALPLAPNITLADKSCLGTPP